MGTGRESVLCPLLAPTGLARASGSWPLAVVGLAASAVSPRRCRIGRPAGGANRARHRRARRGGCAAHLISAGRPFGLGALLCLAGLLALAGIGLAQAGYVRGGAFVAAAILWTAGLIAIFILFPLLSMLRESVLIQGHLTTTALRRYLASPIFLLLRHPELPTDPIRWGAGVGIVVGAAALAGIRLIFGRWTQALAWGMGLGVAAGLVTMLALGLGALRNSLFLAVSVGLISTGLGFIFALLASRSTLWTRRLLAPLSILPIITPAFVLGLAMIYMFGRRGFVTHTLLGLSTNVFLARWASAWRRSWRLRRSRIWFWSA